MLLQSRYYGLGPTLKHKNEVCSDKFQSSAEIETNSMCHHLKYDDNI